MAWTTPATFTSGQILTAAQMNTNVRDNTNALYDTIRQLGYQTRTTAYTTTTTVAPGAANIFSTSISWTALASTAYLVEFYAPSVSTAANAGAFVVVALTTGTGTAIAYGTQTAFGDGTRGAIAPQFVRYFYTPGAGAASVNVRAYHGTAAGTVDAGAGGAALAPMYMAVYGPAIT